MQCMGKETCKVLKELSSYGPAVSVPPGQSLLAAYHFLNILVKQASAHNGTLLFHFGRLVEPREAGRRCPRHAGPARKCNSAI